MFNAHPPRPTVNVNIYLSILPTTPLILHISHAFSDICRLLVGLLIGIGLDVTKRRPSIPRHDAKTRHMSRLGGAYIKINNTLNYRWIELIVFLNYRNSKP